MTRKTYCGNLLWQSSLTLLVQGIVSKFGPVLGEKAKKALAEQAE